MIDILKVAGGCEDTEELIAELSSLGESKVRVFQTLVLFDDGDEKHYTFMTTSKDIHLALGKLSFKSRQNLMAVILRALDIEKQSVGLITLADESSSLLATMIGSDGHIVQLAPMR
jgi:hypothetical protein